MQLSNLGHTWKAREKFYAKSSKEIVSSLKTEFQRSVKYIYIQIVFGRCLKTNNFVSYELQVMR